MVLGKEGKYDEAINEIDKAIKAFDDAMKLNPDNRQNRISLAQAWENKGWVLNKQNKYDEANAAFAKAKELKSIG